jgi:hypothetical protein
MPLLTPSSTRFQRALLGLAVERLFVERERLVLERLGQQR